MVPTGGGSTQGDPELVRRAEPERDRELADPEIEDPDDPDDGVLDPDRVRMLDGLRKDGVSFFERTAASFLGRISSQLVVIHEAVDDNSAASLLATAHQLKGSALNLGLPRVAAASEKLEALGNAGRTAGAELLLDELTHEVELAVTALRRALGERD